jgi:hypothetical protein
MSEYRFKALPIGVDSFEKLVTRGYYFIDKTMFIRELLEKKSDVNLFTRPRRFGKTMNMSMLQYFFEDARNRDGEKVDNSYLFEGLNIMSQGEEYLSHMGQHPVINLSLKSGKQPDFEMTYGSLLDEIQNEYFRHKYILLGNSLDEKHKCKFEEIRTGSPDNVAAAKSIEFLSECLELYYGKKTIILIDEYDVPLENAYFRGFYSEMIDFIRSLFESALKTNSHLEFAVITGCLRISKESIFTGLNNLGIISILSENYAEYYGFVESEVKELLDAYGIGDRIDEAREWYDGYKFGDKEVYNPWSMINYVNGLVNDKIPFPRPYWANTSSNSIVKELIETADANAKGEIENLMAGGTIDKPIHEDITYDDIHQSQDNLWNFLFFTGYLKAVGISFGGTQIYVTLALPNKEVLYIYENSIKFWFQQQNKSLDFSTLYNAIFNKDCQKIEECITEQLRRNISYYDTVELFYHGFVLGILSGLKDYRVKSNREAGNGRTDIVIIPLDTKKPVVIIELKRVVKMAEMSAGCDRALLQIDDNHYIDEFVEDGFGNFIKYGICFCRKNCRVKCETEVVELDY